VSLQTYQRAQVAMVLDRDVAHRISGGDLGPWQADLTPLERERLVSQATDAGLALSRKLHKGWRLTKLLTLLPITFRVGDPGLLSDLVDAYWRDHLPQGLYFEAEAAGFAAFVAGQVPASTALHDAARLEGALLAVGQRGPSAPSGPIELRLAHDPRRLLSAVGGEALPPPTSDDGYDIAVSAGPSGPRLAVISRA